MANRPLQSFLMETPEETMRRRAADRKRAAEARALAQNKKGLGPALQASQPPSVPEQSTSRTVQGTPISRQATYEGGLKAQADAQSKATTAAALKAGESRKQQAELKKIRAAKKKAMQAKIDAANSQKARDARSAAQQQQANQQQMNKDKFVLNQADKRRAEQRRTKTLPDQAASARNTASNMNRGIDREAATLNAAIENRKATGAATVEGYKEAIAARGNATPLSEADEFLKAQQEAAARTASMQNQVDLDNQNQRRGMAKEMAGANKEVAARYAALERDTPASPLEQKARQVAGRVQATVNEITPELEQRARGAIDKLKAQLKTAAPEARAAIEAKINKIADTLNKVKVKVAPAAVEPAPAAPVDAAEPAARQGVNRTASPAPAAAVDEAMLKDGTVLQQKPTTSYGKGAEAFAPPDVKPPKVVAKEVSAAAKKWFGKSINPLALATMAPDVLGSMSENIKLAGQHMQEFEAEARAKGWTESKIKEESAFEKVKALQTSGLLSMIRGSGIMNPITRSIVPDEDGKTIPFWANAVLAEPLRDLGKDVAGSSFAENRQALKDTAGAVWEYGKQLPGEIKDSAVELASVIADTPDAIPAGLIRDNVDGVAPKVREALGLQDTSPTTQPEGPMGPALTPEAAQRSAEAQPLPQGLSTNPQGRVTDDTGATYFGDDYLGNIKNNDLRQKIALDRYGQKLPGDPAEEARLNAMDPAEVQRQYAAQKKVETDRNTRNRAINRTNMMARLKQTRPDDYKALIKSQGKAATAQQARFAERKKAGEKGVAETRDRWFEVYKDSMDPYEANQRAANRASELAPILQIDPSTRMQSNLDQVYGMRNKVASALGDAKYPWLNDWLFGWSSFKDPESIVDAGQIGAVFNTLATGLAKYENAKTRTGEETDFTIDLGGKDVGIKQIIKDLDQEGLTVNEILRRGEIRKKSNGMYAPKNIWGGNNLYGFMADMDSNVNR